MSANTRRIALFLDFENLVSNTGITPATFDLQPTIDRLLEKGKVIFRRAYADWSRFKEAKAPLHEHGVELIDIPPSTHAGKNGADMRLVIDALELCYAREFIDTFVIGSGDSDFCPLAYKLRENNRLVIGVGAKESTSRLFVKACDEFIYLKPPTAARRKAAAEEPARRPRKSAARTAASSAGAAEPPAAAEARGPDELADAGPEKKAASAPPGSAAESGTSRKRKDAPKEIPEVARQVVESLLSRASAPINPSLIKETIVRKQPDFDERQHGFSSFSKLLEAMERDGLLRRQQNKGRQWYVVPPDVEPEPAPEEAAPAKEAAADEAAPREEVPA